MGVLVMEMVAVKCAGVLYTDDPRGGEGTIINAVSGLGSLAVGGVVEPDIYRIEAGRIVAQHVGEKSHMHVAAPEGGVLDVATPAELQGPCLEPGQALALAELGRRGQKALRPAPGYEWALDTQDSFYLLQARPLRVSAQAQGRLPAAPDQGGRNGPCGWHHRLPGGSRRPGLPAPGRGFG